MTSASLRVPCLPTETPQEYQDLHGPQQKPVLGFAIQISDEEQILPFGTVDPHHLASHSWSTLESNTKRVITLDQSTASSENFQDRSFYELFGQPRRKKDE